MPDSCGGIETSLRGESRLENKQKYNHLVNLIETYTMAYNEGKPLISDDEFDALYEELKVLSLEHSEFVEKGSPIDIIISEDLGLVKIRHSVPILSLDKINSYAGIEKFVNDKMKLYHDTKFAIISKVMFIVQEKEDGLTVVTRYNDGKLIAAITRGDGEIGDNILDAVQYISSIPKIIENKDYMEVRGELRMTYAEMDRINSFIAEEDKKYTSTRNLTVGTIKNSDINVIKSRKLDFKAYEIIAGSVLDNLTTYSEVLEILKHNGFDVVLSWDPNQFEPGAEGIQAIIDIYVNGFRDQIDHAIDGLVIKVNDLSIRRHLGENRKHPYWATAYKFKNLTTTTKLKTITNQVGHMGNITPVGELEPVVIDGITISRATLHNYEYIKQKGLMIGDTVVVARANDVIPQILNPVISDRNGTEIIITAPKNCPSCSSAVVITNGSPIISCVNPDCPAQVRARVIHFASRNAMNIEGLAGKTIDKLIEKGYIKNPTSLYNLKNFQVDLGRDGFGIKTVENLIKAIENSKTRPLANFLYSLGVIGLGRTNSKLIVERYQTLNNILNCKIQEVAAIDGIGTPTATKIIMGLTSKLVDISDMKVLGVKPTEPQRTITTSGPGKISCLNIVITGTLSHARTDFERMIHTEGGALQSVVNKNTHYLVMGRNGQGTSKHNKAIQLNTPILDEFQFLNKFGLTI